MSADTLFVLIQHRLFAIERERSQLMFGTSAFHASVHRWSCQLEYNPRLNIGWGFSDGEGNERNWSFQSPLVPLLRFATKQTRVDALHLRACHKNDLGVTNAGTYNISLFIDLHFVSMVFGLTNMTACLMSQKLDEVLEDKAVTQARLSDLELRHGHNVEYFALQWERQRSCQLDLMANTNLQNLETRLGRLITLEESFRESQ